MRALVAVHLVLLAGVAAAQTELVVAGGTAQGEGAAGGGGSPAIFLPFDSTGAQIPDDANTVAHVTWNGSALVDSKGNAWTQNGTVPQVTTGPFFPSGFSAAAKPGAGAFSDVNYYSLGTGADVLDFAGDFYACVVFQSAASGSGTGTVLNAGGGLAGSNGWGISVAAEGNINIQGYNAGALVLNLSVNGATTKGPNVTCVGRAGSEWRGMTNLGALSTNTPGTAVGIDSTTPSAIGRRGDAGASFPGKVFEIIASATTPTSALFTSIQQGVFGHIAATGQVITVTRASTATTSIAGTEYTWPAGVLRIDGGGAIIEPQRTNAFLNSDAPATQTITFGTGAEYTTAVGAGNMGIAVGTATATGLPCTATAASPCSFNVTVGGTVVFTYTAALTFFQVENGLFATSKIHTAGTAVTRNNDNVTFANPLTTADTSWCMSDTATDITGNVWGANTTALLATNAGTATNAPWLFAGAGVRSVFRIFDGASASRDLIPAGGAPSAGTHRVVGCYQGIIQSLTVDTTTSTTVLSGAGTGILSAQAATVTLGNLDTSTNTYLGGWHHKNVAISRSSDPARLP